MIPSSPNDFDFPGKRTFGSDSVFASVSSVSQASLYSVERPEFQQVPPVGRLLYRDACAVIFCLSRLSAPSRLHFNFYDSRVPAIARLRVADEFGDSDILPLKRIIHQMHIASLQPPKSTVSIKRTSELMPYCDYLTEAKRTPVVKNQKVHHLKGFKEQ